MIFLRVRMRRSECYRRQQHEAQNAKAQVLQAYCEPMAELYRQFGKYEYDVGYVAHQGYDISELKFRVRTIKTTVFGAGGR
jgi:hypothetical protein